MLDHNYDIANPTEEMLAYIEANQAGYQGLRRRAVIRKSGLNWILHGCVVEGILTDSNEVPEIHSREYPDAVLYEDWLSAAQLRTFLGEILYGTIHLGQYSLDTGISHRRWTKERQPLVNNYMPYAGYVWASRFHENLHATHGVLLAPGQPYYPDLHEAVQDWLPFTVYHGSSDSRKGEINILLPEARAYFLDATPHGDFVDVQISGAAANGLALEVTGAWWDEKGIHHFSEKVLNGYCRLNIPASVNRLDYILVDSTGTVYDYQMENGNRHTGLGRHRGANEGTTVEGRVRQSLHRGEGGKIEFKPFVRPDNNKMLEIFRTVCAFANAKGGEIFLGISNEGELTGLNDELQQWAEATPDQRACERYINALRTAIRDELQSDVHLEFSQANANGKLVVAISVGESSDKPVTFSRERYVVYLRRGASSMRISPTEWHSISNPPSTAFPRFSPGGA